jgi:hypothetical protein
MKAITLPLILCIACGGTPFSDDNNDQKTDSGSNTDTMADTMTATITETDAGSDVSTDVKGCEPGYYAPNDGGPCFPVVISVQDAAVQPQPCDPTLIVQCATIGYGCEETNMGAVCVAP